MNLMAMAFKALAKKGAVPLGVWVTLVFVSTAALRLFGRPRDPDVILGMAFVYALGCIAVPTAAARWRKRGAAKPDAEPPEVPHD